MNIEQKTSQAVLQQPTTVKIGDKEYPLPKPTVATIIMVSEIVSTLPYEVKADEDILHHVMANAKDMKPLGRLLAVLLMGAQAVVRAEDKSWFSRIFGKNKRSKVDELTEEILLSVSPKEMANIVADVIQTLDIAFFFGTITSLTRVNVLTPTKAASPTTQSGR